MGQRVAHQERAIHPVRPLQPQKKMSCVRNYLPIPEVTLKEIENGLTLNHVFIPEEILLYILSFVDNKSLLKCRVVCRKWRQLVEKDVWRQKCPVIAKVLRDNQLPWVHFYSLFEGGFNKNLLMNHSGQKKLKHWAVMTEHGGGEGWAIEKPPAGADPLPDELLFDNVTTCFATTFYECSKEQIIELAKYKITGEIMDALQPPIEVCEWYAARFDCGCLYSLRVELLDANKTVLQDFHEDFRIEQWLGREWQKVSHTFLGYGKGVRYIRFFHKGRDTQFWAGHYGSKMAGACVKLLPKSSCN